jgi:Zn-dependent protease
VPFGGSFPAPEEILARAITFIIAISVHEFMHAWSALWLGDTTAARQGRVTLNPVSHFDPLGFLFALLLVFGLAPIAWGKPVPVNPYALRGGRRGFALVAFAGPLSNLVMAVIFPIIIIVLGNALGPVLPGPFVTFLDALWRAMLIWNVALFAFNLLPIPPLDGFNILAGVAPSYWLPKLEVVRQYSFIILLLVMFIPLPGGGSLLGAILLPVQRTIISLIVPIVQGVTRAMVG